ncbi:glutaredoxin 3 [Pseudomonas sp. M30-35]|uniref:glutaredoxin 3 n=1 Tax=Pseudomonas sp. M30-35 TaxID=1981174 RepID=UPI000B3CEA3F|nr:glutaredoxin 3 [Pseudomonas sp. M30-35]ARU87309.1 glutaredoxin 3 [Pseudomonas sp. M30-35]
MSHVTLYTTQYCPYCVRAKSLLSRKGASTTEIDVAASPQKLAEMLHKSKRRSVPQIFIGDTHVGGFDDLASLERKGELDALLQA